MDEKEFLKKVLEEKLEDLNSQIEGIMALSDKASDEEESSLWEKILEKKKEQLENLDKAKKWIEERHE